MQEIGKILLFFGALLCATGVFLVAASKLFHGSIHLPGDMVYRKGNFTFYFPLATSILVSVALTLILNVFLRRR